MLKSEIKEYNFPQLHLNDTVDFAITSMEDFDVQQLPVVEENIYRGLISKSDLLDVGEEENMADLSEKLLSVSIKEDQHFFVAFKLFHQFGLSVLPVINDKGEFDSLITQKKLIDNTATFLGADVPGGIIVLEMDNRNFSSGEINRLVETNDATIMQLSTYVEAETGLLIVTIKINKTEVSDVVATLQRYDYVVRSYYGEEMFKNELKENYEMLMTYLNI